jgi:chromosome segregation ATPase
MNDNEMPPALPKSANVERKLDEALAALRDVQAQSSRLEQSVQSMESRVTGLLKLDEIADADTGKRFESQRVRLEELEAKLIDTKSLAHELSAAARKSSADFDALRSDFDNTASAAQAQISNLKGALQQKTSEFETQLTNLSSALQLTRSELAAQTEKWTGSHAMLERRVAGQRVLIVVFTLFVVAYLVCMRMWGG